MNGIMSDDERPPVVAFIAGHVVHQPLPDGPLTEKVAFDYLKDVFPGDIRNVYALAARVRLEMRRKGLDIEYDPRSLEPGPNLLAHLRTQAGKGIPAPHMQLALGLPNEQLPPGERRKVILTFWRDRERLAALLSYVGLSASQILAELDVCLPEQLPDLRPLPYTVPLATLLDRIYRMPGKLTEQPLADSAFREDFGAFTHGFIQESPHGVLVRAACHVFKVGRLNRRAAKNASTRLCHYFSGRDAWNVRHLLRYCEYMSVNMENLPERFAAWQAERAKQPEHT